jgi:hypothetical protein
MDTLNKGGIVSFAQFKQARNRKISKNIKMSVNQLESLITTLDQLMQKARNEGDSCEYYRLCEELHLAQADLKAYPVPTTPLTIAFA